MPNVMVSLPNTGGTLYLTLLSLADAHYQNAGLISATSE